MPKRAPRPKIRKDAAETAWAVVQAAIGEGPRPEPPGRREKNPEAVRRGLKGGRKGGLARAKNLTAQKRKRIAKKAGKARWAASEEPQ
jgi:hypothetical protein